MNGVRVELDVSQVAPAGVVRLVAEVFIPPADRIGSSPVAVVCLPGGGMSRRYFDLNLPGYSMARHLAADGFVVVTIDPPGVGESDRPDDGYALSTDVVADTVACAVEQAQAEVRAGRLVDELPALPDLVSVGVGHSAGGLLTVYQQARHRTHQALGLLGFSGSGLPAVLTAEEAAYADDPDGLRGAIASLAATRFGHPLPRGTTSDSDFLIAVPIADEARGAIREAGSHMLALVGLTSMIPGASRAELEAIEVPVFIGVGSADITSAPHHIPAHFPGASDLTLFVLPGSGHNHNVAPTREQLWDRLARWARSVLPQ